MRLKVPDEVSEEKCDVCGRNMVIKSGRFGRFLACPGYPECTFTKPLVIEMPGRCPKCGGRMMKRTGVSKKTNKQYTYYACEFSTSSDPEKKCDFMTWDVPTKDDCPECGQTMFKKAGKGFKRPYCINPACSRFVPEDQRGYVKKKTSETAEGAEAAENAESAESAEKKPAAKKTAAKKTAAKKTAAKKTAAKTTTKDQQTGGGGRRSARKEDRREEDCRQEDNRKEDKHEVRGQKDRGERRELMQVTVIGAGLAGCEAAWQLAQRGIAVTLHEMKPEKTTPAHHTADFAELCCSNSLRSDQIENAVGLLKEELRRLDSLILACADATRVEAGGALAVDRYGFSKLVTEKIRSHPNITVVPGEVTAIPEGNVIIASGPLTSDALAAAIAEKIGDGHTLNFFDAAAPLVTFESVDMDSAFFASRYDKGDGGLHQLPDDGGGVRCLLAGAHDRRGSERTRL